MGWMPQPKDKDWLNGYKNKTLIYPVYKRPTSNQGTHTDWKWRAGLVVLNSLSFCLSVKLLISPSYLNEIRCGYNLCCSFFSFITLNMSCHSLLAWEFLLKDQLLSLWGFPCVLFVAFPLMVLIFAVCVCSSLVWLICVLGCFSLGLSCLGLSGFLGHGWLFSSPS